MWESVLAKIPGIFGLFATARFHNSKGNWRCASCRFVRDADGAQISIKKSRNIMRNSSARPPIEIPPFVVSDFMSGFPPFLPSFLPSFLHLHHHHHAHHHHHHPHHHQHRPSSKSPRLAWSSSPSSSVSPLLFLPSFHPSLLRPSFLLPSSINYISTTVMLVSLASSLSASCRSEQAESIPGIFAGVESTMLFKNQSNSSNLSSQKWKKSGNFRKKGHNVTCGNPFLQKFPEFLDFLQLRVSTTQKGIEDVLAAVYLWKGRYIYEREAVLMKGRMYFWRAWCIYEGEGKVLEFLKESKVRCFSKTKEILGISHLKSGKNPGIFGRKVTT